MPAKWTPSHTFMVISGAILLGLIAALSALAKDPTYGPFLQPILAVLIALQTYFGLSSGKAWGSGPPTGAAAILIAFAAATGTATSACGPAAQAIAPAASCVSAVIADALSGMTIAQILAKEQGPCVKDVEEIVTILLGSDDPKVLASSAFKEARLGRGK